MTDPPAGHPAGHRADDRAGYRAAAWSWAEHLRSGGSTVWSEWVRGAGEDAPVPRDWLVPGAAQLELVRRLAAAAGVSQSGPLGFFELADVVLGRSGPGRGLAAQPLSWPAGHSGRRFGAPPTDPADVPRAELVRVGVGALTDLLVASPAEVVERTSVRRLPLSRTPAFELAGAPVTTSAVRRALGAAGHAEGGRASRVVLLAEPLDYALAQVWSARVQRGAPVRWPGFVARWSGRDRLPPSADLSGIGPMWADRVGSAEVHVVVAPKDFDTASRVTAGVLGVGTELAPRGFARHPLLPRSRDLTPAAVDVARRVNAVLVVRLPDDRRVTVLRALVSVLTAHDPAGHALTVPEPFQSWVRDSAERMVEDLTSGRYPVHGSLERLIPRFGGLPTRPRLDDALDVVVAACVGQAHLNEAHRNEKRRSEERER